MADNVAKILIKADSTELRRGLDTARGKLESFGKSVLSLKTALVSVAGAAGFGALVKSSLDTVDALAKTADKLGLTTEALAKLRYAAEITGVKAGTFDMALQRMTRRLAEAAQGTGEAQSALKELGLDATRLANISPDQAFTEIAAAMEGVSNQSDKVRLAFKLFDSEGVALVNTLGLGVEGLNQAGREAEFLGVAISSVDAAKVEEANAALSKAKTATAGLAEQFTIALAPAVTSVSNAFANMIANARRYAGLRTEMEQLNELYREKKQIIEQLLVFDRAGISSEGEQNMRSRLDAIREEIKLIEDKKFATQETARIEQETKLQLAEQAKQEKLNREEDLDSHLELWRKHQQDLTKEQEKEAQRRAQIEQWYTSTVQNMQMGAFQHAANLIRALAPESKKAAIVALAIEKGLAIAQTVINTEVASMRALAELGPIAGAAAAAKIRTLGAVSVGLIAATGLAQAASINSGSSGSVATVASQTPSEAAFDPFNTPTQQGSVTINVSGVITDEIVYDLVVPAIQDAVDNRDVVLIRSDSRNAQELSR